MERIGFAASKVAKGNLWLYNAYVVVLTILFSLLVFTIAGSAIVFGLIVIGYAVNNLPMRIEVDWIGIMQLCMAVLTIVVSLVALAAIMRNIKVRNPADQNTEP